LPQPLFVGRVREFVLNGAGDRDITGKPLRGGG